MKPLPKLTAPWIGAYAALALLALALRLVNLSSPHALIFDETYYAKDAWALLHSGFERSWAAESDTQWLKGSDAGMTADGSYVVHPPLGKWLIAAGLAVFGMDEAIGWRIGPAIFGWLTVVLLSFTARRLFRSNLWGLVAGFLLAIDGMHLVMSRSALLDIFLTFFLLAGFSALLRDKDAADERALRASGRRLSPAAAHGRPWRILAGVCFGLALGVKWSALSFIAVFALLSWAWDARRRRRAGTGRGLASWSLNDGFAAFWQTVVVAIPVYLATWIGWITTSGGYNRQWAQSHAHPAWAPEWLASLWNYHQSAYTFHNGLSAEHPYEANAFTWLFMGRPTSYYYQESAAGAPGCAAEKCSAAITNLGNPLIWWAAALALVVVLLAWALRRDWRAGAAFLGVFAGLAPWFAFPSRTMFTFYAVSFEPWLILCLVYALALLVTHARPGSSRALWSGAVACYLLAAAAASVYFWPIWTGQVIDYSQWLDRMWFETWI